MPRLSVVALAFSLLPLVTVSSLVTSPASAAAPGDSWDNPIVLTPDNCTSGAESGCWGSVSVDLAALKDVAGDQKTPTCGVPGIPEVWFRVDGPFTNSLNVIQSTANTDGSDFDTLIWYTDANGDEIVPDLAAETICNDDASWAGVGGPSEVRAATPGENPPYYIAASPYGVSDWDSASKFVLNFAYGDVTAPARVTIDARSVGGALTGTIACDFPTPVSGQITATNSKRTYSFGINSEVCRNQGAQWSTWSGRGSPKGGSKVAKGTYAVTANFAGGGYAPISLVAGEASGNVRVR